jgi:hypothetical protein
MGIIGTRPDAKVARLAAAVLPQSTDADEALRLHNEIEAVTTQLAAAEERWCQLQEEIEGNQ